MADEIKRKSVYNNYWKLDETKRDEQIDWSALITTTISPFNYALIPILFCKWDELKLQQPLNQSTDISS